MVYSKVRYDTKRSYFFCGGKMKKIITIDGKDYTMKSSAYTQFAYRNLTGRSLLKDIQKIMDLSGKVEEDISALDGLIEPLLDVCYVMIEEADATQVKTREDFIKGIESLFDKFEWINDVVMLAMTPISRQLQNEIKQ